MHRNNDEETVLSSPESEERISVKGPSMKVKTLNRTMGVIALTALCGCADPTASRTASAPPAPQEQTASTGPIALTAPPAPASPAKAAPTRRRDAAAKPSAPASAAPTAQIAPAQLVGMDEGEVQALLGSPSTVEDHAPGKTLRFRKHDCVLSVALYPDVQTRVFHTLSYEVTSDDHIAGAKQLCETKFGNVATAD
jgi:hypothetical protein